MSVSTRDHSWAIHPLLQAVLPDDQNTPVYWGANGVYAPSRGAEVERIASPGAIEGWFRGHSMSDLLRPWSRYLENQSFLVEHTSVNPVHPLHVGSLRGSLIGGFLVRLLRSAGGRVSSHYFVNDHGRQTRFLSWILQRTDTGRLPPHLRFDHAAAVLYALANMFHAQRFQDIARLRTRHPWLDDVVSLTDDDYGDLVHRLGDRQQPPSSFWQRRILDAALSDLGVIGAAVDRVEYESTLSTDGAVPVELAGRTPVALVNGAWCVRHPDGLIPLARPDGSWLYFTRDVLNTRRQLAQADHVIHLVGDDQRLLQHALQQHFPPGALDYVAFGVVTERGRKFSARQNRLLTITDILHEHGIEGLWQLALAMTARRRQRALDLPQPASAGMLSLITRARRYAENGHGVSHRGRSSEAWPLMSLLLRTPATLMRCLEERSPHPVTQLLLHASREYLRAVHHQRVTPELRAWFLEIQETLSDVHGLPLQTLADCGSKLEESPA